MKSCKISKYLLFFMLMSTYWVVTFNSSWSSSSRTRSNYVLGPQRCSGLTVCREAENYPHELMNRLIKATHAANRAGMPAPFDVSTLFRDESRNPKYPSRRMYSNPNRRQYRTRSYYSNGTSAEGELYRRANYNNRGSAESNGRESGYQNMVSSNRAQERVLPDFIETCPEMNEEIAPQAVLTDQNEWRYTPYQQGDVTESITIFRCLDSEGQPCNHDLGIEPEVGNRCFQNWLKKMSVVLKRDGSGFEDAEWYLPACCLCETLPKFEDQQKRRGRRSYLR